MSEQTVETILTRAMNDAAFAESLFADPGAALAGFDLTAEELTGITSMSRAEFGQLAAVSPEERKSMARPFGGFNHNEGML